MNELLALYSAELETIRSADFSDVRRSWREHVPEELRDIWSALSIEVMLAVYLTASEAFLNSGDS